jgi:signal transduction histidine kinase
MGVVILATLYGLHRYHIAKTIQKIKAREKIRKEEISKIRTILARDFHDEMGNKLASITVLSSTLDLMIKDKTKQINEALQTLESTAKDLFAGTKSFIWSMDPQSDNLKEIISYINHFAVDLLKSSGIRFTIDPLDEISDEIVLPMGSSRQIYFIFKEALTNAMVHSGATKIHLSCRVYEDKSQFEVELFDNGTGLLNKQSFGKGLFNMKERAKRIKCHLSYNKNKNGGLNVLFTGTIPAP